MSRLKPDQSWEMKCKCCHQVVATVWQSDSEDTEQAIMDKHLEICKTLQVIKEFYKSSQCDYVAHWTDAFTLIGYQY